MTKEKILHVVHCIDTEGPLTEDLADTFQRIKKIYDIDLEPTPENLKLLQNKKLDLNGNEESLAAMLSPRLLNYNNSWDDIDIMLDELLSSDYRNRVPDDFGGGWVYSWHCMDHAGYSDNPRRKDLGFGNIFRFYKNKLKLTSSSQDELNWHYHPLAFDRNPLKCATTYVNSYDVLLEILSRRIIDEDWFPTSNRPGFHTERQDIHMFLEQWIPYDYANQSYEKDDGQPDLVQGRYGDWRRAPNNWIGYKPHHDDYQQEGSCRRWIFRCLNVGTRFNELQSQHVEQAFENAEQNGSAILSFADHDYRDIRPDVEYVRELLQDVRKKYPDVKVKFSGATEAAQDHLIRMGRLDIPDSKEELKMSMQIVGNVVKVCVTQGKLFGPQPFLALKTIDGHYYHDNFDIQEPGETYTYVLDHNTFNLSQLDIIAVGAASGNGSFTVEKLKVENELN